MIGLYGSQLSAWCGAHHVQVRGGSNGKTLLRARSDTGLDDDQAMQAAMVNDWCDCGAYE